MKSKKARTWRTDTGHQLTERELGKLQTRIEGVFEECRDDMAKTAEEYWGKLKVREAKMTKLLNNGEITKEQYTSWYRAQVGREKNFEELRDRMAQRVVEASSYSTDIIRGTLPEMYAINRNWAAYQIESITGADFALWDEHTVKRLLVEKPDLMPNYPIMRAIDNEYNLAYCKTQITNVVTSGIIQGHSIDQMAAELTRKVAGMEMHSAVRAARTATTSAENAGRLDSYAEAEGMGIKMEKEWMATLDSRTRHSHAILDGEHVPVKDTFSNGCRYPADPRGAAAEVYNCRCTLTAWFPELKKQNDARLTYSKWISSKQAAYDMADEKGVVSSISISAKEYAKKAEKIIDKYTSNGTNWSGKVSIFDKSQNRDIYGEYDINTGDIRIRKDASPKTFFHELLHSRSIGRMALYPNNQVIYDAWWKIEEGTVELFAQEICAVEKIDMLKSYKIQVDSLRNINRVLKIASTDMEFAQVLFDYSPDKRYNYLKTAIENSGRSEYTKQYLNNKLKELEVAL